MNIIAFCEVHSLSQLLVIQIFYCLRLDFVVFEALWKLFLRLSHYFVKFWDSSFIALFIFVLWKWLNLISDDSKLLRFVTHYLNLTTPISRSHAILLRLHSYFERRLRTNISPLPMCGLRHSSIIKRVLIHRIYFRQFWIISREWTFPKIALTARIFNLFELPWRPLIWTSFPNFVSINF